MYIRRKVFSRAIDHETGEERLFSVNEVISEEAYLGQREFNSKAAKALKDKYLREFVAPKTGIELFKTTGNKTVPVDPRIWKAEARDAAYHYHHLQGERNLIPEELRKKRFNEYITHKPPFASASGMRLQGQEISKIKRKKSYLMPSRELETYDHSARDWYSSPKTKDERLSLLKSSGLRK